MNTWTKARFADTYKVICIRIYGNRCRNISPKRVEHSDELLMAATHIMQSSSNELSSLVSGKAKM